jgi:SAM-dependent methyltransferase
MNVLVAGCGPGDDLEFVAARGANPIGIDISAQALLMARSRGSKVILANLESLPFRPGVFEVILIMNVIMFTNAAQSLEEAKRIGKAGSSIVLMEPLANAFLISLARRFQPYRKMVTQYWNPEIRLQSSGSWRCLSEDRFFLFSSLWAGIWYERPFPLWARKVLDFISEMDAFLLRVFPWTRRFAYLAVTIFKADA